MSPSRDPSLVAFSLPRDLRVPHDSIWLLVKTNPILVGR